MESDSIFKQFKTLVKNANCEESFNVIPLLDMPHKLGVSKEGYPKFFVSTNDSVSAIQNIILEILSIEYNLSCSIIENGQVVKKEKFSIITLRTLEASLQSYFIDIFIMMLKKLPNIPSKRELSVEVENLITIFSALNKPPRQKIQGLWAELLVIENSKDPALLIKAWHESPSSKYDFTLGKDKIEVKSTSAEGRIHHFSLDQLNISANSQLLVASIIVRESGQGESGLSIQDLYDKICLRVSSIDLRLHLYSVIADTIGSDLSKIKNTYFDYIEASDSLAFYNANDVPHIDSSAIPQFVSDVKFISDMTNVTDIKNSKSKFDRTKSPLYMSLF